MVMVSKWKTAPLRKREARLESIMMSLLFKGTCHADGSFLWWDALGVCTTRVPICGCRFLFGSAHDISPKSSNRKMLEMALKCCHQMYEICNRRESMKSNNLHCNFEMDSVTKNIIHIY